MNGGMERLNQLHGAGQPAVHQQPPKPRNYKLIVDSFLIKGKDKMYRYDGIVPNDSTPIIPRDPRCPLIKMWVRLDTLELPVPR